MTEIQTSECQQVQAHGFQAGGKQVRCDKPAHWAIDPRQHDEAEAALWDNLAKAQDKSRTAVQRLHESVGDKKVDRWTRRERWALNHVQVLARAQEMADAHPADQVIHDGSPINALRAYNAATELVAALEAQIEAAEAAWREHRWTRYILCVSSNGHIHNFTGCHTLRPTSLLQWHPEFSGLTEDEAVNGVGTRDGLGPILCTHCFPSAPSEYKRDPAEVSRERNAAVKAAEREARDAAKAAKNLTREQQFKDHSDWWVTTVAGCLKALRDERWLYYYGGHGPHCDHADAVRAAEEAKRVLLAREAAHPGTGATAEAIAKVVASADRKHKREAGL